MERRAACCYLCYWLHLSIYLYLQTADIMVVVDDGDDTPLFVDNGELGGDDDDDDDDRSVRLALFLPKPS